MLFHCTRLPFRRCSLTSVAVSFVPELDDVLLRARANLLFPNSLLCFPLPGFCFSHFAHRVTVTTLAHFAVGCMGWFPGFAGFHLLLCNPGTHPFLPAQLSLPGATEQSPGHCAECLRSEMSFPCQRGLLPCVATLQGQIQLSSGPVAPQRGTELGHKHRAHPAPLKAFPQGDFLSCSRKHPSVGNAFHFVVISLELVNSWEGNLDPENNYIDEYLT